MTRLQKKCLVFSVGLHGLLMVIVFASAGFSSSPPPMDLQIMTLIPANIVDRAGSGGGTPVVNLLPQPKPQPQAQTQAQPQPTPPPQPQSAPEPAKPAPAERVKVERVPTPAPQPMETKRALPEPDETKEISMDSKPRPSKPKHEIHVSYTLANATTSHKKPEKSTPAENSSSARSEARRWKEIENSLSELASGVRTSASPNTIVDLEGVGGGAAFAGYRNVVFNYYYRAWITPEDSASRSASADAKVVVARDGSIISAELIRSSDDGTLDKSVERALRAVTKLPPFPAGTRDEQRTFVIRFSPSAAKEMSG